MPLIVNGETVDEELLRQEFSNIKSYHQNQGALSCCERDDEFRKSARENVITRVLLMQEAERRLAPVSSPEVDAALAKLKEEHGGEEKFFEAFNITPEQEPQVRADLEVNLRVRKLLDESCGAGADPSDEELRAYYASHLDRYLTRERVKASHILKGPGPGRDRQKTFDELREVREKLLAGADFDELARAHSDRCTQPETTDRGDPIDLGFFGRGDIVEQFELVAFSMKVGEVSPVFSSPFGYHVVKVTGREPSVPKPFEEIRATVRDDFLRDRYDANVRAFIDALRARAQIEDVPEPEAQAS